jgi:Flp pilus assembly protein TadG
MKQARFLPRDISGATAVEFALVLLPLLVLLLGTIEFGRALWAREALHSVATASARCMGVLQEACAQSGSYSATKTLGFVKRKAQELNVSLPTNAISLAANTTCAGVTGFSQVLITYRFHTLVPLAVPQLKDGIALRAQACFPNQPKPA